MTQVSGYSISIIKPVELEKGSYYFAVSKAKQYEVKLVVEYFARTPCKFFANLYPDAKDKNLHRIGAHFDTVAAYGSPVVGNGQLEFSLCSIAPSPSWFQSKEFSKQIVIGLMDYEKWMTIPPFCTKKYNFTLKVV
ncbi:MAG: hypothetical protein WA865_22060 [Spirulinaceae cyanobacterium]